MWIQVRTIDGSQTRTIEDVSRKATIEELRERVWALFDVRPECQRLFYRGKQVRRPAGNAGSSSRRPGTSLGVQGCTRDGLLAGPRPPAVGPPPTNAPSGSEALAGCRARCVAGQRPQAQPPRVLGAFLPAFGGNRSLERQQAPSGSHAGSPEGRSGFIRSAASTSMRTCLSSSR